MPPTATATPTLYLIDGYAQFFRAYHAIRTPMSSPVTKEPTNLTFGYVGMLLKLLRGEGQIGGRLGSGGGAATGWGADFVACVIDVSGDRETFRSELYPDYKAHRPPPPSDLFPQVERCIALMKEIGVPVIGAAGFEADDAIATIVAALRRERPDLRIRIISKDKDLKQLLCGDGGPGSVELYDIHTDLVIGEAALKSDTGLSPRQVVDMLALMGDTVDNVPGVEGVGPKTAAELIATYGSLDALLARAHEIKGKRGEKIRAAGELLALSRKLVTLREDAPVTLSLEDARAEAFKLDRLIPILKELGFNRYQDEVRALLGAAGKEVTDRDVQAAAFMPQPGAPAASRPPVKTARGGEAGPSLFEGLGGAGGAGEAGAGGRADNPNYRTVRTREELDRVIAALKAAPIFAFDTETTGLSAIDCHLCGVSVAVKPGEAWYIPVRSCEPRSHMDTDEVLGALRPLLEDAAVRKCGHNLKFDLLVLRAHGVELRGLASGGFDSMVASYLIDASRSSHSLDALALALLGHTNISIKELIGSGANQKTFDQVELGRATQYAAEDADVALRLYGVMAPQLAEKGLTKLFAEVEMPLVEVLAELEFNGVLVDPAELDRQRDRLAGRISELKGRIDDAAMASIGRTFNPESPKQLAAALFNKRDVQEPGLGLKPTKRTKTGFSTDIEVLEDLAEDPAVTTPIPKLILEHRQLTKLVGTYLVALKEAINRRTGRIHSSFNQTVAVTGRLASSDPNLQNIPIRSEVGREIRRAFVAPPGRVLVSADFSQIELRLLAHLSRDPALTEAFLSDQDIHTAVAAQVFGVAIDKVTREQRNGAKMVNFGIVYGVTPFGLARRLGVPTSEAEGIITAYRKRFSGITTFLQECVEQARSHGFVETMLHRRRPIPDIDSNVQARRAAAERTAINSVVQGSAADLIKLAMNDLYRRLSERAGHLRGGRPPEVPGVSMLLQIHDELVFEADERQAEDARRLIVERMEKAMTLSVPLKADSTVAGNWFDE